MGVTENRYSGIPTIRREMPEGKHPAPEFSAIRNEFKVCLRNTVSETVSGFELLAALLELLRTPRTKKEIADFLEINSVTYAIKTYILSLVEQGLVEMTIPEAREADSRGMLLKNKNLFLRYRVFYLYPTRKHIKLCPVCAIGCFER